MYLVMLQLHSVQPDKKSIGQLVNMRLTALSHRFYGILNSRDDEGLHITEFSGEVSTQNKEIPEVGL